MAVCCSSWCTISLFPLKLSKASFFWLLGWWENFLLANLHQARLHMTQQYAIFGLTVQLPGDAGCVGSNGCGECHVLLDQQ